jgi:hypothetical protein
MSLLLICVLLVLTVSFTTAPIIWVIGDKLDWQSHRLAGWKARNCGHVTRNGDATKASACVIEAVKNKQAFRVRFETTSIDEESAFSIVGNSSGHFYHLGFLGGSPDGGVDFFRQTVTEWKCAEPVSFHKELDWNKDRGMISCR